MNEAIFENLDAARVELIGAARKARQGGDIKLEEQISSMSDKVLDIMNKLKGSSNFSKKGFSSSPEYRAIFEKKQYGLLDMASGLVGGVVDNLSGSSTTVDSIVHAASLSGDLRTAKETVDIARGLLGPGKNFLVSLSDLDRIKLAIEKMARKLVAKGEDAAAVEAIIEPLGFRGSIKLS